MTYLIDKTGGNRKYDLEHIRREYVKCKDPGIKKEMAEAARMITKESREIRSMRDYLIRQHRDGNIGNIKDTHDIVSRKDKYQNHPIRGIHR